ncbi:DUF350 domain-containing protein [Priestia koreensis]|uniref:DUF350 domain-containing protein n=1 Tax=Priestia koreensis TaxID=284581 RepID=UPI002052C09E|nr:DUF350 domain-containing protein [Priestia koreensis]UNL83353.1 DUF350 domain-containing protein [Priestia koreensis]
MDLFLNYLAYAGLACLMLIIGFVLFEVSTRTKELALIGKGNQTAAMVMGGKLLGLAFVLGSSIAHSIDLMDMVIWGFVGIITQIVLYILIELVTIRFSIKKAVEENNTAVGILLLLVSLSVGWVIAQCLTY